MVDGTGEVRQPRNTVYQLRLAVPKCCLSRRTVSLCPTSSCPISINLL